MAIIFCSFVMMRQSAANLSGDSHVVVKNVLKMMSQIAEIIIFILLGVTCIEEFIYGSIGWKYHFELFCLEILFKHNLFSILWSKDFSLIGIVDYSLWLYCRLLFLDYFQFLVWRTFLIKSVGNCFSQSLWVSGHWIELVSIK